MADCKKIGGALIVSVGDEELHDWDFGRIAKGRTAWCCRGRGHLLV